MEAGSSNEQWAQAGFMRLNLTGTVQTYYFWQCDGSCVNMSGQTLPENEVYTYGHTTVNDPTNESYTDEPAVFQDSSGDTWINMAPVNDPELGTTLAAEMTIPWSVWSIQMAGETYNTVTQTPGDATNPVNMSQLEYLDSSGWESTNLFSQYWSFGATNQYPVSGYHGETNNSSATTMQVFDDRYSSEG